MTKIYTEKNYKWSLATGAIIAIIMLALLAFKCILVEYVVADYSVIPANDPYIQYIGRFDLSNPQAVALSWPGIMIKARFQGSFCALQFEHYPFINTEKYRANFYNVIIDDNEPIVLEVKAGKSLYTVAKDLGPGIHEITIFKRTEAFCGKSVFLGFHLALEKKLVPPPERLQRRIEFIGNSITCGYGNEGEGGDHFTGATENSYKSYAAITARALNAEPFLISYSGKGIHINSDSTLTNTLPDMYHKIIPIEDTSVSNTWNFSTWIPDAVVINLGTNDFGNGRVPDSVQFIKAYSDLISKIHSYHPGISFFCLDGPMYSSASTELLYLNPFQERQRNLLRTYINQAMNQVKLQGIQNIYSFSLTPIIPNLGLGAEGHPNVFQHTFNAKELTEFIRQKMNWQ